MNTNKFLPAYLGEYNKTLDVIVENIRKQDFSDDEKEMKIKCLRDVYETRVNFAASGDHDAHPHPTTQTSERRRYHSDASARVKKTSIVEKTKAIVSEVKEFTGKIINKVRRKLVPPESSSV